MGLLDILKAIPMAAGEKARSDEFGPDYRQRWQKYQDEHVRSELQNAISNTEQQDKARKAAAEMYAAGVDKDPGTPPEQAMGMNLAEDRSLGLDKERAGIDLTKAQTGYANARPDLEQAKLDLTRQLGEARNEVEREKVKAMMARVEGMLVGGGQERGAYTWIMGPDGKMHLVNPKGNGGQGKEFTFQGGLPEQPPTTDQRNRQTAMGRTHPILQQIEALAIGGVPDVSGNVAASGLNTGREGLTGRLAGYGTSAAAWANQNPKASQYESLVKGFIPMVARAVGHTGVLTQQDVDSVRALFPNFGDSESVAKMKINQVKSIMSAQGQDKPDPSVDPSLPGIQTPANTHIPPAGTKGMSEDGPVTSDGKGWVLDSIR